MSEMDTYEPKYHVACVCSVVRAAYLTPHVRRIALHSAALQGLERYWRPEMMLRLYFPPKGQSDPPEPYLAPGGELRFKTTPQTEVSPFSAFSEDSLVRAYTARRFNPDALELEVDFFLHETPGLAGDWARQAKAGDRIGVVEFALPAGHRPAAAYPADIYILCADEAALAAAQTNMEAFAPGTRVIAFFEVEGKQEEQPIHTKANLTVTWLHRGGAAPGASGLLLKAIKELPWPKGKVFVWACGEMKTAAGIRQFITEERGLQKGEYKCQAYWRRGKTEVQRMARMTELSLAAAEANPESFQESFENIGMDIVDPTLFDDSEPQEAAPEPVEQPDVPVIREDIDRAQMQHWEITMKTPLGAQKATLHFSSENGKLTGYMDSNMGSSDMLDGTIDTDRLTWKAKIKVPRAITFEFSATIGGESMSGTTKLGPLGRATFTGRRIQEASK